MTTAATLIERSIRNTEIVFAAYSADLADDLLVECEDSTEASDEVIEFWGTTEGGAEWRVHLTGPRKAISAESILAAAGVGLERRSDDAAPVSDRALPIETCRDLVRQIRAAGLEASWAPDNDDRSVGWIYC